MDKMFRYVKANTTSTNHCNLLASSYFAIQDVDIVHHVVPILAGNLRVAWYDAGRYDHFIEFIKVRGGHFGVQLYSHTMQGDHGPIPVNQPPKLLLASDLFG